jgi:hypothetical protein
MKYHHFTQLWNKMTKTEVTTPLSREMLMRTIVYAGFRCQICNTRERLQGHSRLDGSDEPNDVLALCETCYRLAQACKRKRMQRKVIHFLQLMCIVCLYAGIVTIIITLASLLSPVLFALSSAGIYATFLLKVLSRRWL